MLIPTIIMGVIAIVLLFTGYIDKTINGEIGADEEGREG